MPLIKGKSDKSFKKNVETEMRANPDKKDRAQNLAIAYAVKRRAEQEKAAGGSMYAKGGSPSPRTMDGTPTMGKPIHMGQQHKIDEEAAKRELFADGGEAEEAKPLEEGSDEYYRLKSHTYEAEMPKEMDSISPYLRQPKAEEQQKAEGGELTMSGYQNCEDDETHPDMENHEMDNLPAVERITQKMAQGGVAEARNTYSSPEEIGQNAGPDRGGSFNTDNYNDEEDGDGTDMVGRIMAQRYSEGGRVANMDHGQTDADADESAEYDKGLAGFHMNEFDDLALRDDLSSEYTGANSGDELGNDRTSHDQESDVERIMRQRRLTAGRNPRTIPK